MGSSDPYPNFIYDLPYLERKVLCRILDINDTWEELGGTYMKYDVYKLQRIGQAVLRNHSPSDELLSLWGTHNHTILELFILLSKMHHYQAMTVLKPFVNPKYHRLIFEGEGNFSRILSAEKDESYMKQNSPQSSEPTHKIPEQIGKDFPFGVHNLYQRNGNQATGSKVIQQKSCIIKEEEEAKIINICKKDNNALPAMKKSSGEGLTPLISYSELESATGCWDRRNLLGKGGFGSVYKGMWKNTQVAVKRLEIQKGADMEEIWRTQREQSLRELKYLNSCRHDNILALYGYSIGGPHDCLVYQYMPNGSLEDRLLCREQSKPLNWDQRYRIATGTARGLQFLHTLGDKPLLHGDIKSANILLDPQWEPKIGDFGLAREGPLQQYTHVKVSRVHGTRPYLPDEFLRSKKLSTKVDTYSFGIVLFELATGLRAYDETNTCKFLKDHIEVLGDQRINEVRDVKAGIDDKCLFPSIITLGKCCTSSKAKDRPEMVNVLQKLDSIGREMVQQAQNVPCRNSLSPAAQNDQASHLKRSLQQNKTIQGGTPQAKSPAVGTQSNPRTNSSFPTNAKCNTPFHASPVPSGSGSPYQFPTPPIRTKTPFIPQNPTTPSAVSPGIRVSLPSAPNFSDLLPRVLNEDLSDGCDLPLISELGIKSHNSESSHVSE